MKETGHKHNREGLEYNQIKEAQAVYWNLTTPEL